MIQKYFLVYADMVLKQHFRLLLMLKTVVEILHFIFFVIFYSISFLPISSCY